MSQSQQFQQVQYTNCKQSQQDHFFLYQQKQWQYQSQQQQQQTQQWNNRLVAEAGGQQQVVAGFVTSAGQQQPQSPCKETRSESFIPFPAQCQPNAYHQFFPSTFSTNTPSFHPYPSPSYLPAPPQPIPPYTPQYMRILQCCPHGPTDQQQQQQHHVSITQQQQHNSDPQHVRKQQQQQQHGHYYNIQILQPPPQKYQLGVSGVMQEVGGKQKETVQRKEACGSCKYTSQFGGRVEGAAQSAGGSGTQQPVFYYAPHQSMTYQQQQQQQQKAMNGQYGQIQQFSLCSSQQTLPKPPPGFGTWTPRTHIQQQQQQPFLAQSNKWQRLETNQGHHLNPGTVGVGSSGPIFAGEGSQYRSGMQRQRSIPCVTSSASVRDGLVTRTRGQGSESAQRSATEFQRWRLEHIFRHSLRNREVRQFIDLDNLSLDGENEEEIACLLENARRLGIPESLVLSDRDFESADYEALLMLEKENISKGATPEEISKLPQSVVKENSLLEGERCTICLENYRTFDSIRILPCEHVYHQQCIDKWSIQKPVCPICAMDWKEHFQNKQKQQK